MQIAESYSHLNGEEYLLVHHPDLLREVCEVVAAPREASTLAGGDE